MKIISKMLAGAVVLLIIVAGGEIMAEEKEKDKTRQHPLQNDTHPTPTDTWVMQIAKGFDPEILAEKYGIGYIGRVGTLKGYHLFRVPEDKAATFDRQALRKEPEVLWMERQYKRKRFKRLPVDPLFEDQWHLDNKGQSNGTPGIDANVIPAWNAGFLGNDVQIAIVDDGLQHEHPDLKENYVQGDSWDFNDNDPDPSPASQVDYHGTSVGGVAAARDDGSTCGVGAAYRAKLSGIRLISGGATDAMEAQGLTFNYHDNHIFNNSWGPSDDGKRLEGPDSLTQLAIKDGITNGRRGLGTIYVWAAGNGLTSNDNVNYDGYANSRYTIAVGAVDHHGKQSSYSEPGAAMLLTVPSSGAVHISTTDLLPPNGFTCTSSFGGTSSSAPLVSGVIALMLQANSDLSWRDVQHILISSTVRNDPQDENWNQNSAGKWINHKYGFGMIDAEKAITLASAWTGSGPAQTFDSGIISVGQNIADNDSDGVLSYFTVAEDLIIEHVEVVFTATHPYRGDLEIVLTSPAGTRSVLAEKRFDSNSDYPEWKFMSVRHWGEYSGGVWILKAADLADTDEGTFDSWQLILYGTNHSKYGSLQVNINPECVRAAGAKWRRKGTSTWRNSGETENSVPEGSHTVEFAIVPGWNTQRNESTSISSGQTTPLDVQYTENRNTYPVTVSTANSNGTVSGANIYIHNSLVTLKAIPAKGYVFSHWSENGSILHGAGENYIFRVTTDRKLVAHFRRLKLPGVLKLLLDDQADPIRK